MLRGFYFITDRPSGGEGIIDAVKEAVRSGVCAVQYRDKNVFMREMVKEALKLRKICSKIPFIINDRVDVALAVKADGVHLGQDDIPVNVARKLLGKNKIIGLTVHSLRQAEEGIKLKADYLGVSPVFLTSTKADAGRPVGPGLISQIRARFKRFPIVAIGGIKLEYAQDVIASGADALCAISAVLKREDAGAEIKKFIDKINIGLARRGVL